MKELLKKWRLIPLEKNEKRSFSILDVCFNRNIEHVLSKRSYFIEQEKSNFKDEMLFGWIFKLLSDNIDKYMKDK